MNQPPESPTLISYLDILHPALREVSATPAAFQRYLETFRLPVQPRRILLFSGHMLDAPDRVMPRFPADKVPQATQKIAAVLDKLAVGAEDLALTQGACGGDLLFTVACQQRGVPVSWLQPFAEGEFIQRSVTRCGADWEAIYHAARAKLTDAIHAAPAELGALTAAADDALPYTRCNLWLLYTALATAGDQTRFVCLWNGASGDGQGGTAHMVSEVQRWHGKVDWIDTREL